jgi:hypothetical protein
MRQLWNRSSLLASIVVPTSHRLPLALFIVIFGLYFASAAGLYNSIDAPQYFTTEALLRYHTIDITQLRDETHFFVGPDVYTRDGMLLGVRGYVVSVLSAPLHLISNRARSLFSTTHFPDGTQFNTTFLLAGVDESAGQIYVAAIRRPASHFVQELSTTALFTVFSAVGLLLFWKVTLELTGSRMIASTVTILLTIGSYIWKYSSSYTRHGIVVLLLSLSILCVWRMRTRSGARAAAIGFGICWGLAAGIDLFLWMGMTAYIMGWLAYTAWQSLAQRHHSGAHDGSELRVVMVVGLSLMAVILVGNYAWYGTIWFSQTLQIEALRELQGRDALAAGLSTPLFPTVPVVLFGAGQIPADVFANFDNFPLSVQSFAGLPYARAYDFFGLFAVSPFLLASAIGLRGLRDERFCQTLGYCLLMAAIGVVGNSKVLVFWGGNQYDIRYVYPYVIPLGIVAALGMWYLLRAGGLPRTIVIVGLVGLGGVSVLMGWLGVLNMYMPTMLGERRVGMPITLPLDGRAAQAPVTIYNAMDVLPRYLWEHLLNSTLWNRENVWIAVALALYAYLLGRWIYAATPRSWQAGKMREPHSEATAGTP